MWVKDSDRVLLKWENGAKERIFWFWFVGLAFVVPFWISTFVALASGLESRVPAPVVWIIGFLWFFLPLSLPVTKTVRCHRRGGIRVAPWGADPAFADQITRHIRHLVFLVIFSGLSALVLEPLAEDSNRDTLAMLLRFLEKAASAVGLWIVVGPMSSMNKAAKAEWKASQGSADA